MAGLKARLVIGLTLSLLAANTSASVGDRSGAYKDCRAKCAAHGCPPMPLALRLTRWSCEADCAYLCTQALTDMAHNPLTVDLEGLPLGRTVQYHGKWPSRRLWGMQEPASVLFSVLNGLVHARWLGQLRNRLPMRTPYRSAYLALPVMGVIGWACSAVFHTRDTPLTERLDYFSAAASLLFTLYLAVLRLFAPSRANAAAIGFVALLALSAHCAYLTFWRFDYTYNMQANVGVALTHNLLWAGWAIRTMRAANRKPVTDPFAASYARPWEPVAVLSAFMLAGALELFDFPPLWRAIDAHALWHACTVLIVERWYAFLLRDALLLDAHKAVRD